MSNLSKKTVGWMAAALLCLMPMAALAESADGFPEYAETEYEQSIITIPIFAGEDLENPVEILKLTAFMRLERELPKRNGLGHRQIEFTIADWELYGYSEFLDADVTFKLSDVPVQPKSLVISLTEESDYPAMIVYNAIYDIYIGQKRVAKDRPGVAFAKNVYEIPPRNITVAFSKPFRMEDEKSGRDAAVGDEGNIDTGEECPGCPCPRAGCWDPGTCEDMFQITKAEFDKGVRISQAIRAGRMTLRPE
ncbi:MAG: hypothetical protein AAF481_05325 [Acidobacteriota bacterium]